MNWDMFIRFVLAILTQIDQFKTNVGIREMAIEIDEQFLKWINIEIWQHF